MMDVKKHFNPEEHFMDLKGKKYLQVMWRLVWFREDHPDWRINTEIIEHVHGDYAVFKASIVDPMTEQTLSEGHGSESIKDFKDYIEKAETKAVGRALAMLGYGTQFAPELDEEERIVDSPVPAKTAAKKNTAAAPANAPASLPAPPAAPKFVCADCGKEIADVDFKGVKYQASQIAANSLKKYGKMLCPDCSAKLKT